MKKPRKMKIPTAPTTPIALSALYIRRKIKELKAIGAGKEEIARALGIEPDSFYFDA